MICRVFNNADRKELSTAGYSSTPLSKKFGIKEGSRIRTTGAPPDYLKLVRPLPMGLVDVKVCDVDETWSGLKLVVRNELRV